MFSYNNFDLLTAVTAVAFFLLTVYSLKTEDGGSMFLRNISYLLSGYMVLHPT
jgi:hypothetical protein